MPTAETESNKETFRRFIEGMNTNDEAIISKTVDEFVETDAKIRTPLPIEVTGAAALKLVFTTLHRAYPDLHVAVEDVIGEGDKVVARNVVTGTHRGEHMGIKPTGKRVTYDEIFIFRFAAGRIVETWGVVDVLAQMRQLGAMAASPAPATTR